jgi:asparagine synthase (glutamine-hydrolysing)
VCGIAGIIARGDQALAPKLAMLVESLRHRGPDDSGTVVVDAGEWKIGLANTRLAIQDLSPAGHQPMSDPLTGNWLVFNGEIYNFVTLRTQLQALGYRFATGTDTEVILKAYAHWGTGCLARLRGMFAFALWNAHARQLFCARDRLGVKPFYYCERSSGLAFASEVRALLRAGVAGRQLSAEGVASYLALGAVVEPDTIVEGVRLLPAGHSLTWSDGAVRVQPFWSLTDCFAAPKLEITPDEASEHVRHLLSESVRLRLVSEAPAGIFLSGGIDSAALVALASERTSGSVKTVSVVFPDYADYSEHPFIRLVARRFHTEHSEVAVAGTEAIAEVAQAISALDQPSVDAVNTYVVSRQARAAGLTVALSGIGSDELFGGYASFRRYGKLRLLRRLLPQPLGSAIAVLTELNGANDQRRKLARWLEGRDLDDGAFGLLRELFGPADRGSLAPDVRGWTASGWPAVLDGSDFDAVSAFELGYYLRNVLLRDTDVMGMAHSLEIREPYLDHELVEFLARVPEALMVAKQVSKPLLAAAVGELLPEETVRRRKMGFTLPFDHWLRGPLRTMVEVTLLDSSCDGLLGHALDRQAVARLWKRFLGGQASWVRPWALFVLVNWVEKNLDSPPLSFDLPQPLSR